MSSSTREKPTWQEIGFLTAVGLTALCLAVLYLGNGLQMGIRGGPEGRTVEIMMTMGAAFAEYEMDYGDLPSSPENYLLVTAFSGDNPKKKVYFSPKPNQINANREYIDGWGTPLRFVFKGKSEENVLIESAGPDKIFGTADDITNQ